MPKMFNLDKPWGFAWFRQARSLHTFMESGEEVLGTNLFIPRCIERSKRCGKFLLQVDHRSDRQFPFPDTSNYLDSEASWLIENETSC